MLLKTKGKRFNIISAFIDNPKYEFGAYATGYHKSAKILAESFLSKYGYRDYEGYPIVFLYRHAFELNLKNIIYWSQRLSSFVSNDKIENNLYNNHNLVKLAEVSTKLLIKVFPNDKLLKEFCSKLLNVAKDYTSLDKDSFSYRYPIDKNGNYSTKKHQLANILSIYTVMEEILATFEAINFGLDMETSEKFELIEILEQLNMN